MGNVELNGEEKVGKEVKYCPTAGLRFSMTTSRLV